MRFWLIAALALAPVAASAQQAAPVAASTATPTPALPGASRSDRSLGPGIVSRAAPVNGVLTLYGNERCPTDTQGNEIVVCQRRSAAEQFRVPKELREFQITPQNRSWAARAQEVADTGVGVNAVGSCSSVGAAGATGCFAQQARAARAENKARKAEEAAIP